MPEIQWQKSSYSQQAGACVELALVADRTLMRESDDPDVILTTSPANLAAFLKGVKAGEFDHLIG